MINLKFVGILAVFGFLLSFVLGLTGDISFGYVVLRAVISALVSGCTATLVSFVFRKFLSDNVVEAATVKASPTSGNLVDIRVEEEPLPDTENSPDFYVSQAHVSASKAFPYGQQKKDSPEPSEPAPVKPEPAPAVNMAKPVEKPAGEIAGTMPVKNVAEPKADTFVPTPLVQRSEPVVEKTEPAGVRAPMPSEKHSVSEELDSLSELPDIEGMVSDSLESDSSVIEDSVFASEGSSSGVEIPDVSAGNDTSLIADAIRTLLKREG